MQTPDLGAKVGARLALGDQGVEGDGLLAFCGVALLVGAVEVGDEIGDGSLWRLAGFGDVGERVGDVL